MSSTRWPTSRSRWSTSSRRSSSGPSRWAAGKDSKPSCSAPRATLTASIESDLPRWRALRRAFAVTCVATRSTRSPRSIRNRSSDPETCRQSASAHTRSPSKARAHRNKAAKPRRSTPTVCSPSSSPVATATAATVCERLWVSAPSTIMVLVLLHRQRPTPGRHGLLQAMPPIYQVTPQVPDRRRATQHKEIRPLPGRQPQ